MSITTACIFPGQGSQYTGMGKDFFDHYPVARRTFEEADEILGRSLSKILFGGDQELLTETKNSQPAIFVNSIAILRVLQEHFPEWQPVSYAGLSLGEYSALTASRRISFEKGLELVAKRGLYMQEACLTTKGTMAVVLGMNEEQVQSVLLRPEYNTSVWAANFNCPGQIVISGTLSSIQAATKALIEAGAKRVLPLDVHGAFHSPLMQEAKERLAPEIALVEFQKSSTRIAMNVTGGFVEDIKTMQELLVQQVTKPVRWQSCIETIDQTQVSYFIEIGSDTLTGMNKRIAPKARSLCIKAVDCIRQFESLYKG